MTVGVRNADQRRPVTQELANSVVGWYAQRFGRGPTEAKTYVNDDFALVVLGGVQSQAEHTLVEQGDAQAVADLRRAIKQAHSAELCALVGEIIGRPVRVMLAEHSPEEDKSAMVFLLGG